MLSTVLISNSRLPLVVGAGRLFALPIAVGGDASHDAVLLDGEEQVFHEALVGGGGDGAVLRGLDAGPAGRALDLPQLRTQTNLFWKQFEFDNELEFQHCDEWFLLF